MKRNNITAGLLLATVIATPASANWFDNFMVGENHKKLVGSAPTPTPDDLRAIGDSGLGTGKRYRFEPKNGHYYEIRPGRDDKETVDGASGSGTARPAGATTAAPQPPARN